jgi:hypothetical protein
MASISPASSSPSLGDVSLLALQLIASNCPVSCKERYSGAAVSALKVWRTLIASSESEIEHSELPSAAKRFFEMLISWSSVNLAKYGGGTECSKTVACDISWTRVAVQVEQLLIVHEPLPST